MKKKLIPHRVAPTPPSYQISPNKIEKEIHNKLTQLKLEYQQQANKKESQTEEPIYATVLPKSQRNTQSNFALPSPRNLNNILLNTNLGELTDNLP